MWPNLGFRRQEAAVVSGESCALSEETYVVAKCIALSGFLAGAAGIRLTILHAITSTQQRMREPQIVSGCNLGSSQDFAEWHSSLYLTYTRLAVQLVLAEYTIRIDVAR
jgi:hypothetical protein